MTLQKQGIHIVFFSWAHQLRLVDSKLVSQVINIVASSILIGCSKFEALSQTLAKVSKYTYSLFADLEKTNFEKSPIIESQT